MKRAKRGLRWIFTRHLCFGGLVGALLFFVLSMLPSLLPRGWVFQGVISGMNLVIGYGVGSAVSAIARHYNAPEPSPSVKRRTWQGFGALTLVLGLSSLAWGDSWNDATREIMDMEPVGTTQWLGILAIAAVIAGLILVISRGIRLTARLIIRLINRWLPRGWSMALGVVLIVLLTFGVLTGVIFDSVVEGMNSAYSLIDKDTRPGMLQPQSELRSGSEASLIDWDDLGSQGRDFTAEGGAADKNAGPDAAAIESFTGESAIEPIRVYVGLRSAGSLEERVDLAIQELERTNAFERDVVAVYGTTGTGWIDERVSDSLEYIWGGDTAAVGLQYSYLPSWVSFLVDLEKASDTGTALFEAVSARIEEMPEADRPRLFVFGESLGSFAIESAFNNLDEFTRRTDGALMVGPTFSNDLRNQFTDSRDKGSPAWRPVYEEGRRVRFARRPEDFDLPAAKWQEPHIVYLQNSSDPIGFFSFDLLWSEPDWMDEPRAPDANPQTQWFPLTTFWGVVGDLVYSFGASPGYGHSYGVNVIDGWLAVSTPDGWTDQNTADLRALLDNSEQ